MLKPNQPQRVGTTLSTVAGTGMGDFVVALVFISDLVGAPVVDRVGTVKEPPWMPSLEIWWWHGKELLSVKRWEICWGHGMERSNEFRSAHCVDWKSIYTRSVAVGLRDELIHLPNVGLSR
jgi:hypothetical protein